MSETYFVYCAVHVYLTVFVWQTLCVGPKPVIYTLYTPECGSAPVFSTPVGSAVSPTLWLRPSQQRAHRSEEEDEENGMGLPPPAPLCCSRSLDNSVT